MEVFTDEQLQTIIYRCEEIRMQEEQKENYETCAVMRITVEKLREMLLGYYNENNFELAFTMVTMEGTPCDAWRQEDDFMVVYQFQGMFYEFMIDDWVLFETIREKIIKNKSKK